MDPVTHFDWHRIFLGDQPPLFLLEIVFRVVLIYLFAVLLMRVMGKRGAKHPTPFENVVIIALGSATGDSMFYPQIPITYACLVITVVVGLDRLMMAAQQRSQTVNTFVEGDPPLLVRHGYVVEGALSRSGLRRDELHGLLREQGVENTGEVRYAFFERTGSLGLFRYGVDGEWTFPVELTRET